jgi:hypothetical protein
MTRKAVCRLVLSVGTTPMLSSDKRGVVTLRPRHMRDRGRASGVAEGF